MHNEWDLDDEDELLDELDFDDPNDEEELGIDVDDDITLSQEELDLAERHLYE